MRRAALWVALAAALVLGRASYAQGPFADVPTDHWSYDAVNQLAASGVFTGYPDGTFGGKRALTRYEFAVAIQRMYQDLIRRIEARGPGGTGTAGPPGPPGPPGPAGPGGGGGASQRDIDTLRRLATEFQDTLATLGTDVDQLKKELASLSDRVKNVEEELKKMPKITGVANWVFLGRFVDNAEDFVGADNRPGDYDARALPNSDNILEDVLPIYDIDLGITAKLGDHATARLLINAGNYLGQRSATGVGDGYLGGSASEIRAQGETATFDVIPYYAYIETPVSAGSLGASIKVGKFGQQFTPYTLKKMDVDSYVQIDRTDDGNYPVLGGQINFKAWKFNVQAYAARHRDNKYAALTSTAGLGVLPQEGAPFLQLGQPLFVGNAETGGPTVNPVIDQTAGVRANLPTPLRGNLGLTYVEGAGSENRDTFRRLTVYGADLKFHLLKRFGVGVEVAETKFKDNTGAETSRTRTKDKRSWDGNVNTRLGKLSLKGFYRRVGDNFDAPGAWFNIGRWKNPRGLEGWGGSAKLPFGKRVALQFEGASYTIIGARDNEVTHLRGGFNFNWTKTNTIDLGIENVEYDAGTGDTTIERYINIGFGHHFNDRMSFRMLYQIINFESGAVDITPNADFDAAVAVTQFTVRF